MYNRQSKKEAKGEHSKSFQHVKENLAQDKDVTVLSGVKPVAELLTQTPEQVDLVLVRKGRKSRETDSILDLCRQNNIRFKLVEAEMLHSLYQGQHQGVVARLVATGFVDFDTLLQSAVDAPMPIIVALDQVQDPGNVGTFARTLYALGGAGLVMPRHNSAYLGSGARRAAAGALERLPVAQVTNLSRALDAANDAGWTIYGAAFGPESKNAFTMPLRTPAVLVLGNEENGLRQQVAKRCHELVHIPMARDFDSLNVAQAGAILMACFIAQGIK